LKRVRPTILLFDIDGTLVSTGGAGRLSIDRAFELLHGRPDACRHFGFDGMTDRGIARLGLQAIGVPVDDGDRGGARSVRRVSGRGGAVGA
jgi:phosphoglycolate phosphatase